MGKLGTFSDVKGASTAKVCTHCPSGTYFNEPDDASTAYDASVVCVDCPAGSWSNGLDGVCHLCDIGYWSSTSRRIKPCDAICEQGYLCPVGSIDARQFILPQGNDLPVL